MRYKGQKGRIWELVKRWTRLISKNCYTCGARDISSYNAQAGHCWPVGLVGSNNAMSWDHRQIRLQCGRCNGAGQGEQGIFIPKLKREIGTKLVYDFERRKYLVDPIKNWDEVETYWKGLVARAKTGDLSIPTRTPPFVRM